MNNRIFVFGGSGFIGAALLKRLKPSHRVFCAGRRDADVYFDLEHSTPSDLEGTIFPGDVWIFLAAVSSPDKCLTKYEETYQINVQKTRSLIMWLVNTGARVIFSSSDAVFSTSDNPARDSDALNPSTPYGRQKAAIEETFRGENLVKIVRFSYVLGHGDKFSKMLRMSIENHEEFDVFSGFKRNVVLLSDVIIGIQNLIDNWENLSFSKVNFSGPELICRVDIVDLYQKKFPALTYNISPAPAGFWEARSPSIETSCENFTELLGRAPSTIDELNFSEY